MSTDTNGPPLYEVTDPDGVWANGAIRQPGEIVGDAGWPRPGLRPANEAADRIVAYYAKRALDPYRPASPWNARHRCIYLPGNITVPDPQLRVRGLNDRDGFELPPPVKAEDATPDMPRYRPRERVVPPQRGQTGERVRRIVQVGRHVLAKPDETFAHLSWPCPDFEPANEPAKRVAAYYEANHDNPTLLPSPWCEYRRALFLPELPKYERRPDGTPYEPAPPRKPTFSTDARGSPPLDTVKYAEAIAGEVEMVTGKRPRRPGDPGSAPVSYKSGFSTGFNRVKPLPDRR